ncbi:hypothetical protein [Deinococcus radiotolerans]|uniref:Fimbrial biogenesis outer membrane usher protein n=1 Tax=Deinococcus radiotolerans TaxID=1309407 RepID=A0ABQ2FJ12_9DEIO|nr:hypothetical protein [Deinococcus radiotolerans]GGL03012.1 hypothetical protein GCM10010844_22000 [Deinococcus radiotolerans]
MRTGRRARRPSLSPELRAGLILSALLTGHAAASCDAPELLLNVRLGQSERGSQVVRLDVQDGQLLDALLPPDLLRPDEQGYVAERVDCDGVAFVRLKPDLTVTYREERQDLLIRPQPTFLGQRHVDVSRALKSVTPAGQPATGVDFGVWSSATYRQPDGQPAGLGVTQAYVGVGGATARATGYVGVLGTIDPRSPDPQAARTVTARATAQYAVTPEVTLYGAVNAEPGSTQPGFTAGAFTGLTATYERITPRLYPDVTLFLEAPADITVRVNARTLGVVSVGAGEVHLTNIPLDASRNVIQLQLDSEAGVTEQTIAVPDDDAVTPGQDLTARATLGLSAGRWVGQLSAQSTLTRTLAAQGSVQLGADGTLAAGAQVALNADHLPDGESLSGVVGLQVKRTPAPDAAPARVTTTLNGGVSYARGPLNTQARASVPIGDLPRSTVSLRASYDSDPWFLSGSVATAFTPRSWEAALGTSRKLNDRSAISLSGTVAPSGYSVQVRGSYVFTPDLRGEVTAAGAPGAVTPAATLTYTPTANQVVAVRVSPENVNAAYGYTRDVALNLSASLTGAEGQVTGALSRVNGQWRLSPALVQRGVLVRTGVPGLPLIVDGGAVILTDPRGDVLIPQPTPAQTLTLRVNTRELPLGIAVGSSTLEVRPAPLGLTTVDWRANFTVSSFVRFFWAPGQPAVNADLLLNGELIPLDDEGYGLVERGTTVRTGELRGGPDGTRRCAVQFHPAVDTATCAP